MSIPITQSDFKTLISERSTKEALFRTRHNIPNITIESLPNQTIIKGDFTLSEDLVFEAGEKYDKELFFDGGSYKNIIFRGGSFKRLFFRSGNFNGFVSIRGGSIGSLVLIGGNFNRWLGTLDGIKNEEEGKPLAEEPLIITRFEIEGGTFANNMWISGGEIERLEIKSVSAIKIHCKPSDDKIFDKDSGEYVDRFKSTPDITNLIISRYSNKDNFFHFSLLKFKTIKFENFTNIGNITISQVKVEKSISFENSDLGKTSFIDCDFSKQEMYFDSSKITEISLAGVLMPQSSNIISKSKSISQKKLALSQIKKVYQNMGDSVIAGQYQAEELETYMTGLKPGFEKFNLYLNSLSNKHGQSWQRALGLLLLSSSLFFILYCFALGFEIDFCSQNGVKVFFNNLAYLVEFINPIRKSDFLPKALFNIQEESKVPTLAILIDSFSKLINAYLIYQFIAAFRKHGKKSE